MDSCEYDFLLSARSVVGGIEDKKRIDEAILKAVGNISNKLAQENLKYIQVPKKSECCGGGGGERVVTENTGGGGVAQEHIGVSGDRSGKVGLSEREKNLKDVLTHAFKLNAGQH